MLFLSLSLSPSSSPFLIPTNYIHNMIDAMNNEVKYIKKGIVLTNFYVIIYVFQVIS